MYAIYGNIYHQYTPNVSIYTIHGSYGPCLVRAWLMIHIIFNCVRTALAAIVHLDQARKHRGGAQPLVGKLQWSLAWGLTWMVVVKFIAKCLLKVAFCFTFFGCDDYLQSCHVILSIERWGKPRQCPGGHPVIQTFLKWQHCCVKST